MSHIQEKLLKELNNKVISQEKALTNLSSRFSENERTNEAREAVDDELIDRFKNEYSYFFLGLKKEAI